MELKNHPEINAHYVNETVQHFLQARGIVNHLCPAIDHGGGWCRFAFLNQATPRNASNWIEPGFHGFPLECLASIIQNGLLESSPDRSGCRFSEGPGLYLTRQGTYSAQNLTAVLSPTVLWFSVGSQWSALLIAVSIYPARKGISGCNELAHAPRLRCGCKQHPMMTSSQVSASCPCGFLCWRCLHRLRCMHVRIQMSSTGIVCMFIPAPPSFVMPLLSLLSNFNGISD